MLLTDYIRRILLRWRIIVATVLLSVGAVAAISFSMTPTYESNARVFVSSSVSNADLGAQMAAGVYAQQKVLSYAAVASSSAMAERVIDSLGLQDDPAELASRITTAVEYGTVLVTLTVQDTSAQRAADIANAVIDNYNLVLNEIDSSSDGESPIQVSVMEPPSTPSSAVSPNFGLNLSAAVVVGLLLGLALAALRDLLDETVRSEADIEELGGVAVIGTIIQRNRTGRLRKQELPPIVPPSERSSTAESLRQLRTNLRFAAIDRAPRTILITSTKPGEGKSFVSSSLASVTAATGQSVLLVDLDLRRPVQATRFGLEQAVGVTSVLLARVPLDEAIQQVPDAGFDLLSSGALPPNPTEVLATAAMHDLLRTLAERYDTVIIDSPPLGLFDDARQIARVVDGTIVVSRFKSTRRSQVEATVKGLLDINARVLGVVINFARSKGDTGAYGYYYDSDGQTPSLRS